MPIDLQNRLKLCARLTRANGMAGQSAGLTRASVRTASLQNLAIFSAGILTCLSLALSNPARTSPVAGEAKTADLSTPYRYDVSISLTGRAAKKLLARDEKIVISASYFGLPTDASLKKADGTGRINFWVHTFELPTQVSQIYSVRDTAIDAKDLGDIGDVAYININVFSARKRGPDNLLNCSIYEDRLTKIEKTTAQITCDLIYPD